MLYDYLVFLLSRQDYKVNPSTSTEVIQALNILAEELKREGLVVGIKID